MPGVDSGAQVELHDGSVDDGISESVFGGARWRSWFGSRVSKLIYFTAKGGKILKTFVSRGGRDARVPNEFVTSGSHWAATSKSSRIRRFSRSRPAFAGASSTCACANVRFFLPLLNARSTSISSSPSARRCPWSAAYSSSPL